MYPALLGIRPFQVSRTAGAGVLGCLFGARLLCVMERLRHRRLMTLTISPGQHALVRDFAGDCWPSDRPSA